MYTIKYNQYQFKQFVLVSYYGYGTVNCHWIIVCEDFYISTMGVSGLVYQLGWSIVSCTRVDGKLSDIRPL